MNYTKEDLYFFNQGKLFDAYRIFGAHLKKDKDGSILGTTFTVWAPRAKEVRNPIRAILKNNVITRGEFRED